MIKTAGVTLATGWCLLAQGPVRTMELPQILDRVAEQAEAFRKIARSTLAEETLEQRARIQTAAAELYSTREVVSEYGYGGLPDAPTVIHEIRKVISVDGKQVLSVAKARQAMTLGLTSADDKLKKKLLEDFEKHGLKGAVTDFGQVILLFSARHRKEYKFELAGERMIGADRVIAVNYQQISGAGGVTVFRNNGADKEPLKGEILVRTADGLPLRITMSASQKLKSGALKDELEVDYAESPFGCILPAGVVHREYFKDELVTENTFRYGSFRRLN
jgi:hypothetical protein